MKRKTSFSSKFRVSLWAIAAVPAIVLDPYGNVNTLLEKSNPWRTFYDDGPVLAEIRVSREEASNCRAWENAFFNNSREVRLGKPRTTTGETQWATWFPMEPRESESIENCHQQPCEIKLSDPEVGKMAAAAKADKLNVYLSSVIARGDAYLKDGTRTPYEYSGGISDPWKTFEKLGLKGDLSMPSTPNVGLRKLDFHNDRARVIRQMVDRRVMSSKDQTESTLWLRDVYTNHYFDSWGEWGNITCDPIKREATLTLAVTLEFDVLKNNGLLASVAKRSAKNSMRDLMENYLNTWADQIKEMGVKNSRP
jgi:hypothetical protein